MTSLPITLRAVAQVTQSPTSARRWLLTLDCGHEKWVTASRRPKVGKKLRCLALACLVGEEKEKSE